MGKVLDYYSSVHSVLYWFFTMFIVLLDPADGTHVSNIYVYHRYVEAFEITVF